MTVIINFTQLQAERAEKLLDYYRDGLATRDETRAKLMAAFRLELADAEVILREVDHAA